MAEKKKSMFSISSEVIEKAKKSQKSLGFAYIQCMSSLSLMI